MKTWFCRDSQKWVSEIPRSFWTSEVDYTTGEKIYSDDIWLYNVGHGWESHNGVSHINDARNYKLYVKYKLFPYTHIYGRGMYKKVICKKVMKKKEELAKEYTDNEVRRYHKHSGVIEKYGMERARRISEHESWELEEAYEAGWDAAIKLAKDLIKNSKPMPPEFSELVDEHFDELI